MVLEEGEGAGRVTQSLIIIYIYIYIMYNIWWTDAMAMMTCLMTYCNTIILY